MNSQQNFFQPRYDVNMRGDYTITDYLLDRLFELGVKQIFGVAGDFVLNTMDLIVAHPKMELICTCNELNAGYAADAYSRIQGLGALCVTYNVGGLSALNALAGAFCESIPIVLISGAPSTVARSSKTMLHHTNGDYSLQEKIYSEIMAATVVIEDASLSCKQIDWALVQAMSKKAPVYIEIPTDLAALPCARPQQLLELAPAKKVVEIEMEHTLHEAITEIGNLVKKARSPVLLAGGELVRFGHEEYFASLLQRSHLCYATTLSAKGVLTEDNPHYLGTFAGDLYCECTQQALSHSDCVIALGVRTTDIDTMGVEEPFVPSIQVFRNRVRIGSHYYEGVSLQELLKGLCIELANVRSAPAENSRNACPEISPKQVDSDNPNRKIKTADIFQDLNSSLPDDGILVVETGDALFASAEMVIDKKKTYIAQSIYMSIGYALPATLGVTCASPERRTFCVSGDGSFQMTCQELSTLIRYHKNPVIILLNNDGYTIERVIDDNVYNDIQPWKYHLLPQCFGECLSFRVETLDEWREALSQALKNQATCSFIEVKLERLDCSEPLRKMGDAMQQWNR